MKKIVLDKHAIKLLAHLGQCTVQDLENIEMELEQYGGPSLSRVFLASKQRSTSFCNEIINSVRVFILFYLRFSILNYFLKARLISNGFSILNQISF